MNRIIAALLAVAGMFFLFMGMIFVIGGSPIFGALMLVIGFVILLALIIDSRREQQRPTVVQQQFNVQMGGSGQLKERDLRCKQCGAPLKGENLTVVQGGIVAKCPYCSNTSVFEEEPKW